MQDIKRFINKEFTISQEKYETGWNMPYRHFHNDYEIYILESGVRTVSLDECEYETKARDASLFLPNHPHGSKGECAFSGICIHFSKGYLATHLTTFAQKILLDCFETPIISLSAEQFEMIKKYADHFVLSAPDNFVILSSILKLLNDAATTNMENGMNHCLVKEEDLSKSDFKINFEQNFKSNSDASLKTASKVRKKFTKVHQILEYTKTNYTNIHSIHEIAEAFDVSEDYIFKIFKRNCNQTPKEYINELRINHACYRLTNSENTVTNISEECGYKSKAYFIRLFKEKKGITPSEYRKQMLSKFT